MEPVGHCKGTGWSLDGLKHGGCSKIAIDNRETENDDRFWGCPLFKQTQVPGEKVPFSSQL